MSLVSNDLDCLSELRFRVSSVVWFRLPTALSKMRIQTTSRISAGLMDSPFTNLSIS
mgnify:CR=1 FL=1